MDVANLDPRTRKRLVQVACVAAWSDLDIAEEERDACRDLTVRRVGVEPGIAEAIESVAEAPDHGALPGGRRLDVGESGSSLLERLAGDVGRRDANHRPGLADLMEGSQDVRAEVRDHAVGRASTTGGAAHETLGRAEEALQFVGRCGDPRVIETVEQVLPIARIATDEVIDEVARRRSQAGAGGVGDQGLQMSREPPLGLFG